MLTLTAQSQLADAMAQMMRTCAVAATRSWTDTAIGGLSLWSELMAASVPSGPSNRSGNLTGTPTLARETEQAYASYRSGGGHASAQVIVAGENAARACFMPMYGLLAAWRAALGQPN